MKTLFYFGFLLFAFSVLLMGSCKKKNNTTERKKIAWAVGVMDSTSYGTILFSNDGGDTWVRQGEGSPALKNVDLLYDVWAINENTVWAVGTDNHILKTTDGGQNWKMIPAPDLPFEVDLSSISIVNKTDIWISGSPGIVYHSPDDGLSWTVFDTAFFQNGGMQGIWAINSQVVYVAGGVNDRKSSGFIARTRDGGKTWETVVPPDNYNRNEWIGVKATDEDNIVIYGCKAHYTHTTDGGKTWLNDSLIAGGGGGSADINCLTMLDKKTWWGAFDLENIFITYDTGNTWNKQPSAGGGNMFLVGIDAYDRNLALITGTSASYPFDGKIIKTNDGGNTWELKYFGNVGIWKVSFIKE